MIEKLNTRFSELLGSLEEREDPMMIDETS